MDFKKIEIKTMEDLFREEVMYESYVRSLTDDFSVVDMVNSMKEDTNNG